MAESYLRGPRRPPPRHLQRGFLGIAALARLGRFTEETHRRRADGSKYVPLVDIDAEGPRRRRRGGSLKEESQVKKELEEERRQWYQRYVEDDKWDEANTTVWFPLQAKKRVWDVLILFVLMYSIVIEPYRLGLTEPATGNLLWFETLLSVFLILDILFTFNTAYLEPHLEGDHFVIDRWMIATNYVQGRFVFEVAGAYPAELIDLISNVVSNGEVSASNPRSEPARVSSAQGVCAPWRLRTLPRASVCCAPSCARAVAWPRTRDQICVGRSVVWLLHRRSR